MKLVSFVSLNAILLVAAGIAFALYGPMMLSFFGVPEALETSTAPDLQAVAYWNVAAFARMFGAALFCFGLLLWSVRSALPQVSTETRRSILLALVLAYLLCIFVAVTQQYTIWLQPAGWVVAAFCLIFTAGYVFFMAKK